MIEIRPVDRGHWAIFEQSETLFEGALCFGLFVDGVLVGFNSAYIPKHHSRLGKSEIAWGHRLVVLPSHRGQGLGLLFDEWLGEHLRGLGYRYLTITTHAGMAAAFERSPRWTFQDDVHGQRVYTYW